MTLIDYLLGRSLSHEATGPSRSNPLNRVGSNRLRSERLQDLEPMVYARGQQCVDCGQREGVGGCFLDRIAAHIELLVSPCHLHSGHSKLRRRPSGNLKSPALLGS